MIYKFTLFFLTFIICLSANAQVTQTPEGTWNNIVKEIQNKSAQQAFIAICRCVDWGSLYEEIKEENWQFLQQHNIQDDTKLSQYTRDEILKIISASKLFSSAMQNQFLRSILEKILFPNGNKINSKKNNVNIPEIERIISDLDKPTSYLQFKTINVVQGKNLAEIWVQITDLRNNNQQNGLILLLKKNDLWYLKSYAPFEMFKNFNPRIDSNDMQRIGMVADLLLKMN